MATVSASHARSDSGADRAGGDLRGLKLTLLVYLLLFALKLAAYVATGVMALLGEALHTLSDIFIAGFLLVAVVYARRRPDRVHVFGYGRAQNVAALVAATLFISFTSYTLYTEAIPRLFTAEEVSYQNLPLAVGVLVISMLLVGVPFLGLLRRRARGAAEKAQFLELINDELGLVAALAGTLFVVGGIPIADPIATLVVATVIAVNAAGLFRENASFLLGRSPDAAYLANLEQQARSVPGVVGVHDVRAEYIGPDTIHAGLHIEVARGLPIEEATRIADAVDARLHQGTAPGYCVIRVEAAAPETPPAIAAAAGHR